MAPRRSSLAVVGASPRLSGCNYRHAEDDFFCLRYGVWYNSRDCAIRTKFRTCEGCLNCEQGRFNLKRHETSLTRKSWSLPALD